MNNFELKFQVKDKKVLIKGENATAQRKPDAAEVECIDDVLFYALDKLKMNIFDVANLLKEGIALKVLGEVDIWKRKGQPIAVFDREMVIADGLKLSDLLASHPKESAAGLAKWYKAYFLDEFNKAFTEHLTGKG